MSSSSSARDPRSTSVLCRSKAVTGVAGFVLVVDQMAKWRRLPMLWGGSSRCRSSFPDAPCPSTQPTTKQQTEQQMTIGTHSSGLYPAAPTTPSPRQRGDIVQCRQISLSFDDRREGGEGQEGGGEDGLDRADHRDGL
jgi:hypothetical protein